MASVVVHRALHQERLTSSKLRFEADADEAVIDQIRPWPHGPAGRLHSRSARWSARAIRRGLHRDQPFSPPSWRWNMPAGKRRRLRATPSERPLVPDAGRRPPEDGAMTSRLQRGSSSQRHRQQGADIAHEWLRRIPSAPGPWPGKSSSRAAQNQGAPRYRSRCSCNPIAWMCSLPGGRRIAAVTGHPLSFGRWCP